MIGMSISIELNPLFLKRMQAFLQEDYPAFLKSFDEPAIRGLRLNTAKISHHHWNRINPFKLEPVPWTPDGFYYSDEESPGKHPYHDAGLYYIQEPSAMAVAALANPAPGEFVLDLCAAPGGKSTQLAALMHNSGLLVSNEINLARAKILSQNIERMGLRNAVVTQEKPERLSSFFPKFFDKIVVDAPCSGEGMFRKNPEAILEWGEEQICLNSKRQSSILKEAYRMLKEGGTLIYSTCTFAPEENEAVLSQFLDEHPDCSIIRPLDTFSPGAASWLDSRPDVALSYRLWPHRIKGEGHFIALIHKAGTLTPSMSFNQLKFNPKLYQSALEFLAEHTQLSLSHPVLFNDQLYDMPFPLKLDGLRVIRPGFHLGTLKKDRFEPSHALALSLNKNNFSEVLDLKADDRRLQAYLRGEALPFDKVRGWVLITVDGYGIGFGKSSDGLLKNHYPKALRKP